MHFQLCFYEGIVDFVDREVAREEHHGSLGFLLRPSKLQLFINMSKLYPAHAHTLTL